MFILHYVSIVLPFVLHCSWVACVLVAQSYFPQHDDDNVAQAKTLHATHKVSFIVLENRFVLDWEVTFSSTAEGKGSDTDFVNIYVSFFYATQGQSR